MGRSWALPLTGREAAAAAAVVAGFGAGLAAVYLSMPASDYSFLKLPHTLEELQILRDHLERYTSDYTIQVLIGYCSVYIFMQTFMIPGTVFLSLLAGALFGVFRGVALVVFAATAGASSCFFLSKYIGRPLVFSLWPDKLSFFQAQAMVNEGDSSEVSVPSLMTLPTFTPEWMTQIFRAFQVSQPAEDPIQASTQLQVRLFAKQNKEFSDLGGRSFSGEGDPIEADKLLHSREDFF